MALKIHIHAIGIINELELKSLIAEYNKRIKWPLSVKEFPQSSSGNEHVDKLKEAEKLWPKDASSSLIITLDEKGKQFSSHEFAGLIKDIEDKGTDKLYFLIGGPSGHLDSTIQQSKIVLSLSKMTFPHKIARLLLIEQIYRAQTINKGHPYHRN